MTQKDKIGIFMVGILTGFFFMFGATAVWFGFYELLKDWGLNFWQIVLLNATIYTALGGFRVWKTLDKR